ncbi:hypothetical protein lwe2087 [Listeria welshimeri serovar 6b str. SLCC5334]|uniref:Uncharacterized protein n=1 Tax=Listeria welshimeri serovar 6b (strain ATCC 35897 / DSM 20650 / CCUG 15529 / CIP 8149 / NCTC 11857 / SLCC 5334 / V8) TaxID=386043 RepID=A0AKH3_LISW6|nr:hypothetical protein lwe2087 [Listeria welshimeri serovar 6b str. SLCC5334]
MLIKLDFTISKNQNLLNEKQLWDQIKNAFLLALVIIKEKEMRLL